MKIYAILVVYVHLEATHLSESYFHYPKIEFVGILLR